MENTRGREYYSSSSQSIFSFWNAFLKIPQGAKIGENLSAGHESVSYNSYPRISKYLLDVYFTVRERLLLNNSWQKFFLKKS
jgi:hypothetical protein